MPKFNEPAPPEPTPDPLLVRMDEAVRLSGWSRNTIYRCAMKGQLRLVKHGRTTGVDYASLKALIASLPEARLTNAA